jgi:hypothetical protein
MPKIRDLGINVIPGGGYGMAGKNDREKERCGQTEGEGCGDTCGSSGQCEPKSTNDCKPRSNRPAKYVAGGLTPDVIAALKQQLQDHLAT